MKYWLMLALCMVPAQLWAQDFGSAGTVVPSGMIDIARQKTSFDGGGDDSSTVVMVRPSVQYFIVDNWSVGAGAMVGLFYNDIDSTRLGASITTGYNFGLSDNVSIWPQLALSYTHTSYDEPNSISDSSDLIGSVYAPVMLHLNNFFVGFGPSVELGLLKNTYNFQKPGVDDASYSALRLTSVVGGWF